YFHPLRKGYSIMERLSFLCARDICLSMAAVKDSMNLNRAIGPAAALLLLVRAAAAAPPDAAAFLSTSAAVSDAAALKPLLDDTRLAEILTAHPAAALRPVDPDVHDDVERPGGGRRF